MSIKVENLNYIYGFGTAMSTQALNDISIEIPKNIFMGLIGHTGSGKSTFIQQLNGLLKPTSGKIIFDGKDIYEKGFSLTELRRKVGLVFQYPEYQLFETDVFSDVCFGPGNLSLSRDEVEERAEKALKIVGLNESYYKKSPFELSGGEKRRVAIAGVLAMEPEYIILDEPTAGLDPKGREAILNQIATFQKERDITVILVSHSMEDIAQFAQRVVVMNEGSIIYDDYPWEVFSHYSELEQIGLRAPEITYVVEELRKKGYPIGKRVINLEEAKKEILRIFHKEGQQC